MQILLLILLIIPNLRYQMRMSVKGSPSRMPKVWRLLCIGQVMITLSEHMLSQMCQFFFVLAFVLYFAFLFEFRYFLQIAMIGNHSLMFAYWQRLVVYSSKTWRVTLTWDSWLDSLWNLWPVDPYVQDTKRIHKQYQPSKLTGNNKNTTDSNPTSFAFVP